ncbi:MAG TPA: hypothetical protein VG994_02675 [Steroidobacteraceae bacterium]|nr:hypothetical protein [Steroidobacteraceae bacterium]
MARSAESLAADQRALADAKAYLAELKAERKDVSGTALLILDEQIRDQADRVSQLQTWIDGGRI